MAKLFFDIKKPEHFRLIVFFIVLCLHVVVLAAVTWRVKNNPHIQSGNAREKFFSLNNFTEESEPVRTAQSKPAIARNKAKPESSIQETAENIVELENTETEYTESGDTDVQEEESEGDKISKGAALASYTKNNFSYIQKKIRQYLAYPPEAKRRGIPGRGVFVFTIHKDGSVSNIQIKESSGEVLLDEAALKAIKDAAPFRPPPFECTLAIPVSFSLR